PTRAKQFIIKAGEFVALQDVVVAVVAALAVVTMAVVTGAVVAPVMIALEVVTFAVVVANMIVIMVAVGATAAVVVVAVGAITELDDATTAAEVATETPEQNLLLYALKIVSCPLIEGWVNKLPDGDHFVLRTNNLFRYRLCNQPHPL
ncbi:hypothetical protein HK096_003073, partial [Nowakowskiella sp. JEL0078]